jgi:hypothetical protein
VPEHLLQSANVAGSSVFSREHIERSTQGRAMAASEILIIGKLALTFGVLLGLPLLDLWLLSRRRRRNAASKRR